jgi:hypothetical protein
MPSDRSVWFDDDEGATPVKEPAQEGHHEPCRVGGTVRFDLAFLKQRELFSKEQIRGGQRTVRATQRRRQPGEVRKEVADHKNGVGDGRDQMAWEGHRDPGSHSRMWSQSLEKAQVAINRALQP